MNKKKREEMTSKSSEFICSTFNWLPLEKQKEQVEKMEKMTKKKEK